MLKGDVVKNVFKILPVSVISLCLVVVLFAAPVRAENEETALAKKNAEPDC